MLVVVRTLGGRWLSLTPYYYYFLNNGALISTVIVVTRTENTLLKNILVLQAWKEQLLTAI